MKASLRLWWHRWKWIAVACVVGAAAGAILRGLLPPFVLDDPFWRDFFSGPPTAGLFAVVGAVIAYLAARAGARATRKGAERQEWWDRAEWALNLARSDESVDRIIGLRALGPLSDEATETEFEMILAVTTAVTGDIDIGSDLIHNDKQGRWRKWPWQK